MTRQEFIDTDWTWWDLYEWCNDQPRCDVFENIYSQEGYDDAINEDVSDNGDNWQNIRDWLYNLPDGYDFYRYDDWGEWHGLDDSDLDDVVTEALTWGDENDVWDDEEDGEGSDEDNDPFEEELLEEEPIGIDDLLSGGVSVAQYLAEHAKSEREARDKMLSELVF